MSILPAWFARPAVGIALALGVSACSAAPAEVRGTFVAEGLPRVNVAIAIQSEHLRDSSRYEYAAFTTLKILGEWLVPFPDADLSVTAGRAPWWTAPAAMAPEYAVARVVSHRYWERVVDTRALPGWFINALSEYSARRAVSKIVDQRYLAVYRARAEGRYFGGFVPRDLRIQLPVEDDGDHALLALGTLERWTGKPVFDAILLEFITSSKGKQPSLADFWGVADRVSGQQLSSWFMDRVFRDGAAFDFAVESLSSQPQPDGWYRTTVAVRRMGDAFGRDVLVETAFAGGETVRENWDTQSQAQTFEYRSRTRAVSADIDPDRVILLDTHRSNNGLALDTTAARTAATRWSARWMLWLEDALLTYVALT